MFEHYTEKARDVVRDAGEEARALKHNYIGTEHILLGLLQSEGLARPVLNDLGVELEDTRNRVREIVGQGDEVTTGQIPLTPRAKKVLESALREALSLGHNYIGTEHILLGLVREVEGVAARILEDKGVDASRVKEKVAAVPDLARPGAHGASIRKHRGASLIAKPSSHNLLWKFAAGARLDLIDLLRTAKDMALDEGRLEIAERLREIERDLSD